MTEGKADELRRLAALADEGILTEKESEDNAVVCFSVTQATLERPLCQS